MDDAEIRGLVERIVQERIAPLRALLSAYANEWSSENTSSGGAASSTPATLAEADDGLTDLLPFEIGYDLDSESMSIYAPFGCILVDGAPAEITGASEEGYVDLADLSDDDDDSSEDSTVYAHVTRAVGGDTWSVTFDCEEYGGPDSPPERFDFAVARYLGWPRKERLCASVVSLSTGAGGGGEGVPPDDLSLDDNGAGGTLEIKSWADPNRPKSATKLAADLQSDVEASWEMIVRESDGTLEYKSPGLLDKLPPGNFEPVFDAEGKLSDVGRGYWPFGRDFYSTVTMDNSAKILAGTIYLEIEHSVSDDDSYPHAVASAVVKGAASGQAVSFVNHGSSTVSRIPLYEIAGGKITIDFRSAMSLTMRDLA